MKTFSIFVSIFLLLALTACGAGNAAQATLEVAPQPVVADETIVAEGRSFSCH